MSDQINSFGAIRSSKPGSTCVCVVPIAGIKNALAIVVSYAPPVGTLTYSEAGFWGGLTILPIELSLDPAEELLLDAPIRGGARPVFEARMHSPRDQYLFPLSRLQGSPLVASATALTVILHPAVDNTAPTPTQFRGFLNVAGDVAYQIY